MDDGKISNESFISDYKSFDSIIVESRTFESRITDIKKDPKLEYHNDEINNHKFKEISIIKTSQNKKLIDPHLLIEDKGFKNETFRQYEISLITTNEEKIIKCYRRFSNFDVLNKKLREKYPYVILPSLPQKNYTSKLINVSEDFYCNRVRELIFYMNYIYNHEILKKSNEFLKFLNDADFDEDFYRITDINELFPESEKSCDSSISSQLYNYFSGFFKPKEYFRVPSIEESSINKLNSHYLFLNEKFSEMRRTIKCYLRNIEHSGRCNDDLASNFLYLKEVNFDTFNSKTPFTKINEVLLELTNSIQTTRIEESKHILENLQNFLNVLKGLNEAFERWYEFIKLFEKVDKAVYLSKSYPNNFNLKLLAKEHQTVTDIKNNFYKYFTLEIAQFCKANKDIFFTIVNKFNIIFNKINNKEMRSFNVIDLFLQTN